MQYEKYQLLCQKFHQRNMVESGKIKLNSKIIVETYNILKEVNEVNFSCKKPQYSKADSET